MLDFRNLTFSSANYRRTRVILPSHSKFRLNRTIRSRVIAKNDFQYGVRPPSWFWEFLKFSHISVDKVKYASAYQISSYSNDSRLRYGDITIFKMVAVRHVQFIVTSSYCIGRLCLTLLTLCYILTIGFILSDIFQLSCFTILTWNSLFCTNFHVPGILEKIWENIKFKCCNPQKAHLCVRSSVLNSRRLTYFYICYLYTRRKNCLIVWLCACKKKMKLPLFA